MYLKEVKKAKNVDEALRIFKQENPGKSATGDIFVANGRTCYGVILDRALDNSDATNFYCVAKGLKNHFDWASYYARKIKAFEKKHPNVTVLLSAGGIRLFYIFITITGDITDITDEEIKQSFNLSLIEKR